MMWVLVPVVVYTSPAFIFTPPPVRPVYDGPVKTLHVARV